ncbi:MAG: alpha/beta hydrolase [Rhodobacterales bacterium]|tara:strand:- start:2483 stop:3229 length:747 start_codon:yes stop_codon:yes gene_type:complete
MKSLLTECGRELAFSQSNGDGPGIVFLGGFMSDMAGTKALNLAAWCKKQKRPFLRFDYSGHGASSGSFVDGCIGDWAEDAQAAITTLTEGPQVLVGSSMGGWISLLMAQRVPERVAGLVTIAAAPDFTEDGFWRNFNEDTRKQLNDDGVVNIPSEYSEPYPITKRLIEDGRLHLVLRKPLKLSIPVRLLQGDQDDDVSVKTANQLFQHLEGPDVQLTLLKGADHRFSTPAALSLVKTSILDLLEIIEN